MIDCRAADDTHSTPDQVILFCGGSFFPLHDGHLRIMTAAKEYFTGTGHDVIAAYFVPTHPTSLARKFPGLPRGFDNRQETSQEILRQRCPWAMWYTDHWDAYATSPGFAAVKRDVLRLHAGASRAHLVQVTGIDEKVLKVLRGKADDQQHVIVADSRGVPLKCMHLLSDPSVFVLQLDPDGMPFTSSTIARFVNRAAYPPVCVERSLDLRWLRNTEMTLFSDETSVNQLMLLGTNEVVVRLFPRCEGHAGELRGWRRARGAQAALCADEEHNSDLALLTPSIISVSTVPDHELAVVVMRVALPLSQSVRHQSEVAMPPHVRTFLHGVPSAFLDRDNKMASPALAACRKNFTGRAEPAKVVTQASPLLRASDIPAEHLALGPDANVMAVVLSGMHH